MTASDARYAVELLDALRELPAVRKRLSAKLQRYTIALELSAAEMNNGEGQRSQDFLYLLPKIGHKVVDVAEELIRSELKRLDVTPGKS